MVASGQDGTFLADGETGMKAPVRMKVLEVQEQVLPYDPQRDVNGET